MHSIRIVGAGSIGNHLAHAARHRGWKVVLTDIDDAALQRAQTDIYPGRYGAWDNEIELKDARAAAGDPADVVFIGTPPDSHVPLALEALEKISPQVLLIEKPLGCPDLAGCEMLAKEAENKNVFCAVGYNHCLGMNTVKAEQVLASGQIGQLQTITAHTREHWKGIFNAHPWLSGPSDSYLGFSNRGGGACGEHSHAINIWQHFAHAAGAGRVTDVSATLDQITHDGADYDQAAYMTLRTAEGLVGDVVQDVVTSPHEKSARLQGDRGFLEWHVNHTATSDMIAFGSDSSPPDQIVLEKTRPDDFIAEIDHLAEIMAGRITSSPISLERGLETMMVISAAFRSHALGRRVTIDWDRGYCPEAIN
ncbi:MAG: Gfo/Idh/MocA family oxidoreductase [Anderseniella sp.]